MATSQQTYRVKCESYSNSIIPRIYQHFTRGLMADCSLSAEGKVIKAHKLILSVSSKYFEKIFNDAKMEKSVVVIGNMKYADLCLILDYAYLGEAKVPFERLDNFFKAAKMLRIRGIKDGRHRLKKMRQRPAQTTTVYPSFDAMISSTQEETFNSQTTEREDVLSSSPSTSGISQTTLKTFFENYTDANVDQTQMSDGSKMTFSKENLQMSTKQETFNETTTQHARYSSTREPAESSVDQTQISDGSEMTSTMQNLQMSTQQETFNETTTQHARYSSTREPTESSVDQTQMSFGSEMASTMQNLQMSTQQKTFDETTTQHARYSSTREPTESYVDQTQMSFGSEMTSAMQNLQMSTQQKTFDETTTQHARYSSTREPTESYVDQTQMSFGSEMTSAMQNLQMSTQQKTFDETTTQHARYSSTREPTESYVDQTQISDVSEMTLTMQNLQMSTQQKTFNETTTEYIPCESSPRTQIVSYVDQTKTLMSYGPEMSLTTQNKKQVSSIFGLPKYARVGKQDKNVDIFGIIQSGPLVMTSDVQPKKVKATSLKTIDSHNILNATSLAKPKSIRNKHVGTSPVKAVCRFCSKQFKNVDQLNLHERCCQFNPNRSHNRCPICKIEVRMDLMTYHNRVYH